MPGQTPQNRRRTSPLLAGHYHRKRRSRSAGNAGHDAGISGHDNPESLVTLSRNTQFAQAVASGDVPIDGPDPDVPALRKALLALPGIGPWTVEYVAMRAWRDPDAWQETDLVLMQALADRDPSMVRAAHQRA